MELWEHWLIIISFIGLILLVKLFRSSGEYTEEQEAKQKEIEYVEQARIENHYHTHDNRTINIIVKDGTELKTVLSKKANQTKLLGE